ncbi:DNA polymerase IV [Citricoccus sp. SGAir0253]|uniref:DNA polymerase IV n=1 Tax=Citricoccus sp. SGAir0253 TaxID=2567881 RepID=UPI0010CCB7FC|nr:DNA polymerase IV [Citricoccus sp. SGAir0253]QCU77829.1 DNA polymerase IV [Citricoccus sp. SGAir0253]
MDEQGTAGPGSAAGDPSWDAVILHVDMDAFYLSVELLDHPELVGRPALVAHRGGRSVVLSASYEARRSGVRSAMPLAQAVALCPGVAVVEPRRERYTAASREVMGILSSFTPLLEQLSIDEAFLDVSGARRRLGAPARIGELVRHRVRERTGLPCTVGAATTKSVAKIASTRAKPDGLWVVPGARTREFLDPLPVSALWGVGPKLHRRLVDAGLETVGDLAAQSPRRMERWLGVHGPALVDLARGIDPRPVVTEREAKSVGVERTFDVDVQDPAELHRVLVALSHECAYRLRGAGARAGAVTVKVKAPDLSVRNRTRSLPAAVDSAGPLAEAAEDLLRDLLAQRRHPVRLLGIRAERLAAEGEAVQEALLWEDERPPADWNRADRVADDIRRRFPAAALRPATLVDGGRHARRPGLR